MQQPRLAVVSIHGDGRSAFFGIFNLINKNKCFDPNGDFIRCNAS